MIRICKLQFKTLLAVTPPLVFDFYVGKHQFIKRVGDKSLVFIPLLQEPIVNCKHLFKIYLHDFDCQSFYDIYQTKKRFYEIKQMCYIIRLRNNLPGSFQDEVKKVKLSLEVGRPTAVCYLGVSRDLR